VIPAVETSAFRRREISFSLTAAWPPRIRPATAETSRCNARAPWLFNRARSRPTLTGAEATSPSTRHWWFLQDSQLSADAGVGMGGNITITAGQLLNYDSTVTVSSVFGTPGTVLIDSSPDTDIAAALTELHTDLASRVVQLEPPAARWSRQRQFIRPDRQRRHARRAGRAAAVIRSAG